MKKVISCEFSMDSGCVEVRYTDGSLIAINCTAVERQIAENRFERAELDWLIYNDPVAYANMIFSEDIEAYLKSATDYSSIEN